MKILTSKEEIKEFTKNKKTIGFTPTMGNLHAGHLSLLKDSLLKMQVSIISIYVNPTQFSKGEDLEKYPRTLKEDKKKIEELELSLKGSEVGVFLPEDKLLYPRGEEITVKASGPKDILEGKLRPTHFDGVTTVVSKLFDLVMPTHAFFGEKDYQQLKIIERMVKDLDLKIEIVPHKIIRDTDGLALSSRNQYLTEEERTKALILPETIKKVSMLLKEEGLQKANEYINTLLEDKEHWNYLAIKRSSDLSEAKAQDTELIILGNYKLGSTKLLDNLVIK